MELRLSMPLVAALYNWRQNAWKKKKKEHYFFFLVLMALLCTFPWRWKFVSLSFSVERFPSGARCMAVTMRAPAGAEAEEGKGVPTFKCPASLSCGRETALPSQKELPWARLYLGVSVKEGDPDCDRVSLVWVKPLGFVLERSQGCLSRVSTAPPPLCVHTFTAALSISYKENENYFLENSTWAIPRET